MGFYLKKSIKCGPLRFNLSNSGIGVSTGVKGLRAGVDSKGRGYVSGGKGILRYKKQITSSGADGAGFQKSIAIILCVALILTVIYFISPNIIDDLINTILGKITEIIR